MSIVEGKPGQGGKTIEHLEEEGKMMKSQDIKVSINNINRKRKKKESKKLKVEDLLEGTNNKLTETE